VRTRDIAPIGFIDGDVVFVQNRAGCALQCNLRLDVGASGSDLSRARLCEVILILDDHQVCGESDSERLLFYSDGLLLQPARLYRSFVSRARLPHRLLGISDLQTNLILQLLAPHLSLPDL